jgi:hypothetical protein
MQVHSTPARWCLLHTMDAPGSAAPDLRAEQGGGWRRVTAQIVICVQPRLRCSIPSLPGLSDASRRALASYIPESGHIQRRLASAMRTSPLAVTALPIRHLWVCVGWMRYLPLVPFAGLLLPFLDVSRRWRTGRF